MSEVTENEGSMDFSKMKVNDLKKLLKSRGLSVVGVKQDLIERLQSSEAAVEALLEGSEAGGDDFDEELDKELDESALMADEEHPDELPSNESIDKKEQKENNEESTLNEEAPPAAASPKKTEEIKDNTKKDVEQNGASEAESQGSKQVKVILKTQSAALSEADKKKARAERFGTTQKPQGVALARRAERFSLNKDTTSKAADSSTSQIKVTSTTSNEVLKRRAERFGILSPVEVKRQHLEKLQARKLRFQQSTSVPSPNKSAVSTSSHVAPTTTTTTTNGTKISSSLSLEERKRLRTERFKITT